MKHASAPYRRIVRHDETVARYREQFPAPCEIERCDWPYECIAKDRWPGHEVWRCNSHGVWWHDAPGNGNNNEQKAAHRSGMGSDPLGSRNGQN